MSNNSSQVSSPSKKALEPNQHVNFTLGMVLGEDDFNQEFTYLSGRDLWLARDLLGYGTVCGLAIGVGTDKDKGPYVQVAPGVALSPRGQLIRVTPAQCAYMSTWIADDAIQSKLGKKGVATVATLYLTLCYRDCYTENRPVPGEPCRTEAEGELVKPARIQDDFSLELRWEPPDQIEEDALRDFVAWLRQVKVTEAADKGDTNLQKFARAIRKAAQATGTTPTDYMHGDPPAGLKIPGERACEYLRLAFRIWATELRPMWRGQAASCVTPTSNDCVLLGMVQLPAVKSDAGEWIVDQTKWSDPTDLVDETSRPYVIHLRMLQEWLTCGRDALLTPSDHVKDEMAFDQASDPGSSELFSRGDHTHGTPPRPFLEDDITSAPDTDTVSGLHTTVDKLQGIPLVSSPLEDGYALTLKRILEAPQGKKKLIGKAKLVWAPAPLSGEVAGPLTNNRVAAIQTLPVSEATPTAPKAGQVLVLKSFRVTGLPTAGVPDPTTVERRLPAGSTPLEAIGGSELIGDVPAGTLPTNIRPGVDIGSGILPGELEWEAADLPLVGDVSLKDDRTHIDKLQGRTVDAGEPKTGQVLKFVKGAREEEGRWIAADPSGAVLPNLIGDVTGTLDGNHIEALQKQPLFAPEPKINQVLKFVEKNENYEEPHWEAADLTSEAQSLPMTGDVGGTTDQNVIERLQAQPVYAPKPEIGQVLKFVEKNDNFEGPHWEAVSLPPFEAYAAGVCRFDSFDRENPQLTMLSSHGKLEAVRATASGQDFELTFALPTTHFDPENPNYIVKLTPWVWQEDKYPFTAYLKSMTDRRVVVGVMFFGEATALSGHLMIEISRFTPDPTDI